MKINLMEVRFNGGYVYKYLPFDWCCDECKNDKDINLTDDYDDEYELETYPAICETRKNNGSRTNIPIQFCPYCGEPIEFITKEVNMSSEFQAIGDKIDQLEDAYINASSRKEEEKIREEQRKADAEEDWYFTFSKWDKN